MNFLYVLLAGLLAWVLPLAQVGATELPNGGVVNDAISSPGEVDVHTFTADLGQYIWMRLVDTNVDDRMLPTMKVYDPSGKFLQLGSPDFTYRVEQSGVHKLVISDTSSNRLQVGPYAIHYTASPGANAQGALVNGAMHSDQIELGDLDSYTFFAELGDFVYSRVSGPTFSPGFKIIRPDGLPLQVDSSAASFVAPMTGIYTLILGDWSSNDRGTGPYNLYFARAPGANEEGMLVYGGTRNAYISRADIDSFTFKAQTGDSITISVLDGNSADKMTPLFEVIGPRKNWIGYSYDNLSFVAESGTYTAIVADFSSNRMAEGPYALHLQGTKNRLSYAALGDSYSSGEGVSPYLNFKDTLLTGCHRSTRAYPMLVRSPGSDLPISERIDGQLDFFACSGAVTGNVSSLGEGQNDEPPQLSQLNGIDSTRDLVTISIGGNDAQFARIVGFCLTHSKCNAIKPFEPYSNLKLGDLAPLLIAATKEKVLSVHTELRNAARSATILVLGYPILVSGKECAAASLPPTGTSRLSRSEQMWLRNANIQLNSAIAESAATAGLFFVDVADRFKGHEVCGDGEPWINGVKLFNPKASFHPTARGQAEYASAVNDFLATRSIRSSRSPATRSLPRNPTPPSRAAPAKAAITFDSLPSFGDLDVALSPIPTGCRSGQNLAIPGRSIDISGNGFAPGETILLVMNVEGTRLALGSAVAGSDGKLQAIVAVPRDIGGANAGFIEALGRGNNSLGRLLLASVRIVQSETTDSDGDRIPDFCDNCTLVANPDQHDSNNDGYGNACDADLDNNGIVDRRDQKILSGQLGRMGDELDADFNGDRVVDKADLRILKRNMGKPPGPSHVAE